MYKPNNKKMLTVLIAVAMIFSAFAILSFAAEPAYAASGSFTTTPTVFAVSSSTVVGFPSGSTATFSSGATVTFYANTVNTFPTGAIQVGTLTLPAGTTTLTGLTTTFDTASLTAGTYYLAATDGSGFASGGTITVTSLTPEISLSGSTAAGATAYVSSVNGHPFDPSSTVNVYLNYSGSSDVLISSIAVGTSGYLPTNSTTGTPSFKVPKALPEGTYNIVATESSTTSPTPNSEGITADAVLALTPSITVSVPSISGAASSQFTIDGYGFAASATIAASPSTSPTNSVTVAGIDAIFSTGVSISSSGSFTLAITGLASAISSTGPQTIVVTTTPATTSNSFADAIYVSKQTGIPSITVTDLSTGTNSGYVGDMLRVVAYNFLDSENIAVTLGSTTIASGTTDSNGYFAATVSSLAAIPGGSYSVFAQISSSSTVTEYASTTFKVLPEVTFTLAGYYAAVGASARITGTGLTPNTEYAVTDTGYVSDGGTGNIVYDYEVLGIGSITNTTGAIATNNMGVISTFSGLFSITYSIEYYALSTGANQTVTTTGGSMPTQSSYYYAIGPATVTSSAPSYNPSASPSQTATITVSGLIPEGSLIAGSGVSSSYSLLLLKSNGATKNTVITVSANGGTANTYFTTTSGSATLTFGVTSSYIPLGADVLAVVYESHTTSLGSANVTGSTPGSAAGTSYEYIMSAPAGSMLGWYLYDYPASTSVTYYYYTTQGKQSFTTSTDSNGAANLSFSAPLAPAGTYHLATYVTVSGLTSYYNTSFSTTAALSSVPTTNSLYPLESSSTALYPNENVTLYAYGLSPQSYYGIYAYDSTAAAYISDTALAYFTTDTSGSYSSGVTVTLPAMTAGDSISLDVLPATSSPVHTNALATFTFTAGTYNNIFGPTFNYTSNTETAFPGQLVNFAWTPPTPPHPVGSGYGPIEVTVYLNGTAYMTVTGNMEGTSLIAGSFPMPNNDTGAYWTVTLGYTQVHYGSTSTTIANVTMSSTGAPTLQLVSGAGALIVGISTSGLTTIVSNAVTSAFKVPLAELNASITSIKGLTANITTAFGKMTTTLSAINATVASIESGQVLVQTDLGSIKTSLASLNASIVAFNGNVATISTTLGQVQTSLSSIGTQVKTNGNGIATITTDLGTLSGTVTSTNGTVSSISTSLGTLNSTVQKINSNTQGFGTLEVFLIVIVVLVLITLVLSFMAVTAANKASRKVSEEKKQ
ncbi:MAG: hypothetical protein AMDU3_IPLC00001G0224 [Thermoplasmatales archaeon I-plasma]|nr:MAG: hypothetical protein AMDU3_IPLC00001G0224 [Thermoplasmatales archaeon I-plasma]